eukprot:7395287-Pyramimonas_sp.AAC.2
MGYKVTIRRSRRRQSRVRGDRGHDLLRQLLQNKVLGRERLRAVRVRQLRKLGGRSVRGGRRAPFCGPGHRPHRPIGVRGGFLLVRRPRQQQGQVLGPEQQRATRAGKH